DQDLVVVLQELARLVDLGVDVVLAGLGPDPDLLQLLLVDLAALARLLVTQLAVVEDLADRRALPPGYLDQVEVGLTGHVHGLGGRHDAELLPVGADQPDRADPDLFVHSRTAVLLCVTIGRTNTSISFFWGKRTTRKGSRRPFHQDAQ